MRLLHVGIQADLGYTLLTHKCIGRVRRKLLCVVKVVMHPGKARKKKRPYERLYSLRRWITTKVIAN